MAQGKGKKPGTVSICTDLAKPVAEQLGVYLWEVAFEKEGAGWYLRYYIDREDGVDIDTCEAFSRAMSDILDREDPIDQSYYLEVGSPGIERRLTCDWHFQKYMGEPVVVRLIRPLEGQREFMGILTGYDSETESVTITPDDADSLTFPMAQTAYVRLFAEL